MNVGYTAAANYLNYLFNYYLLPLALLYSGYHQYVPPGANPNSVPYSGGGGSGPGGIAGENVTPTPVPVASNCIVKLWSNLSDDESQITMQAATTAVNTLNIADRKQIKITRVEICDMGNDNSQLLMNVIVSQYPLDSAEKDSDYNVKFQIDDYGNIGVVSIEPGFLNFGPNYTGTGANG